MSSLCPIISASDQPTMRSAPVFQETTRRWGSVKKMA